MSNPKTNKETGALGPINLVLRAWITVFAIVGIGLVSVFFLSRPESVGFEAKFKCKSFRPGSPIQVTLDRCTDVKFGADKLQTIGLFVIPRVPEDNSSDEPTYGKGNELKVYGTGIVSARIAKDDIYQVYLNLPSDGEIELPMAKKSDPFGVILVTGSRIGIMLQGRLITAVTPLKEDDSGFVNESNVWFGKFRLDGYLDQHAGVPEGVILEARNAIGPVSIAGDKDEVGEAWVAVDFQKGKSSQKIKVGNGRLSANDLSSCALTVGGEPADVGHTIDSLQLDIIAAELVEMKIYQDSSQAYLDLNIAGIAKSVRVENKEQIESKLTKLLSRPTYKTGLVGVSLGLLLLAGGIILKRALETLVEAWLPKKG
jgi:hypothetical protein